jgi:tetratricopeptide (TPR) repeat protein
MEGKKYILILSLALLSCCVLGQNNKSIYNAYASGNMTKWKAAMDSVDALKQKKDKDVLDLINYQYGYIAWCIGSDKEDEAEKYLTKATLNLEKLELKKYNESMLYAYKAAFVGFEIGLANYKAPFMGMKSLEYAKKSVSIDISNALGYMQLGNIYFYMPKMFGGSKTEALAYYLKALTLMESNKEYKTNNWNYLNLLATIIHAYVELNKFEEAKKYCIKTLTIEPGFDWVKNNLYPKVLKNVKK